MVDLDEMEAYETAKKMAAKRKREFSFESRALFC